MFNDFPHSTFPKSHHLGDSCMLSRPVFGSLSFISFWYPYISWLLEFLSQEIYHYFLFVLFFSPVSALMFRLSSFSPPTPTFPSMGLSPIHVLTGRTLLHFFLQFGSFWQCTRWFKYDRDKCGLCTHKSVPVIFEPPCILRITNVSSFTWTSNLEAQKHVLIYKLSLNLSGVCGPTWGPLRPALFSTHWCT